MIPVLTQPCHRTDLEPLGVVAASSNWDDDFVVRYRSLPEKLREQAPKGTTVLYNLHFIYREYHGHHYLIGFADAYTGT